MILCLKFLTIKIKDMFIEILNYPDKGGCKARCATCPKDVSGPNSGQNNDLMIEVMNRIKSKFTQDEIKFSLQSDVSHLLDDLKKFSFDVTVIDHEVGCNIKFPFDEKVITQVFDDLELTIPNIKLELFLENRGFLAEYKEDILKLVEIFISSGIHDLSIACHNNSIRSNVFDQGIEEVLQRNLDLFNEILSQYPSNNFSKSFNQNSTPFYSQGFKKFASNVRLHFFEKHLGVSERIIGFEDEIEKGNNLISYYMDFFNDELKGQTFNSKEILLAITPIGVRVNHRSIDIKNPYLWLSYDEFLESLETAKDLDDLCVLLKDLMSKTKLLDCVISEINYETIQILANTRKQLVV
jgi:hypothetical protein